MGVASGCGEQEVGVASGSGWNLWVWLLGVVVRRYSVVRLIRIAQSTIFFRIRRKLNVFRVIRIYSNN